MTKKRTSKEKTPKESSGQPGLHKSVPNRITRPVSCLLFLAAFLFLMPLSQASADVIWTPNDTFYEENYEDCDYIGRRHYANGPKGYVTVMESPVKNTVIDYIANGSILYVSMTYEKGNSGTWGVVQYILDENGTPIEDYSWEEEATIGWIKMEHLSAVYDGTSFIEEHAAKIQPTEENNAPEVAMPDNGVIYLWEYPGSELSYGEITELIGDIVIDQTYEDENGDIWGHSVYHYGYKNFWINLSNPGEESPRLTPPEPPQLIPPASPETLKNLPETTNSNLFLPLTIAALILLTILLTLAAIRFMAAQKKQ